MWWDFMGNNDFAKAVEFWSAVVFQVVLNVHWWSDQYCTCSILSDSTYIVQIFASCVRSTTLQTQWLELTPVTPQIPTMYTNCSFCCYGFNNSRRSALYLQEGMKSWIHSVTLLQSLLAHIKEINEWWIDTYKPLSLNAIISWPVYICHHSGN